jgi:ATP-dependent exoDNAse (exonuclease V) beta subunit
MPDVHLERVALDVQDRARGPRLGALVHTVLSIVPLDASEDVVKATAALEARIIGAPPEEVDTAVGLIAGVLGHPLLADARAAAARGACRREVPVTLTLSNERLLEGTIDLAFERGGAWTVVDFKTDADVAASIERYRMQVALYGEALTRALSQPLDRLVILNV